LKIIFLESYLFSLLKERYVAHGVLGSIHFRQSAVFQGGENRQKAVIRFLEKCHLLYYKILPHLSDYPNSILKINNGI